MHVTSFMYANCSLYVLADQIITSWVKVIKITWISEWIEDETIAGWMEIDVDGRE